MRLSYVKVAEYQRRGTLHFHAVLRLDGRDPRETMAPPPRLLTHEALERALRDAAAKAAARCASLDHEDNACYGPVRT